MKDPAHQLTRLLDETDALLAQVADEPGLKLQELREKLALSMKQTRGALAERPAPQTVKLRYVPASLNDYVKQHPWMALATGVLLASTVGILAASTTKRSLQQ
jgi:ElaB/YqjD/DUF883 family membrane-anchored ribosome-binding protein